MMKTTLDLPDDLIRQAKLSAVVQGHTLRDLMADFIRQGLGLSPSGVAAQSPADVESAIEVGSNGIPVFKTTPHAGNKSKKAKQATIEEILALERQVLAEEDLLRVGLAV